MIRRSNYCKCHTQKRCIVDSASRSTSSSTTHSHVHQSTLTNIHPRHLYQIVNNVDKYKDFLPYCLESKILQTSQCGTMMDAVLRVGLPGLMGGTNSSNSLLEERYVSRVRMIEAKSIQSNLFDSLKSRWQLSLIEDDASSARQFSCNVNFEVEIQVSNPLISFTLDRVLKDVANAQVDAFEKRCRAVPFYDGS
ncbi:hypothetical protein ACHAWC_008301 [Mediolabrus comicus]